jgi:hypothetical protein
MQSNSTTKDLNEVAVIVAKNLPAGEGIGDGMARVYANDSPSRN